MPARSLVVEKCGVHASFVAALGDRGFDRLAFDIYNWAPDDVARMLARPIRELALSGSGVPPDLPDVAVLELRGFKLDPAWRAPASVRSLSLACRFPELSDLLTLIANQPSITTVALSGTHLGKLPMNNSPVSRFADEIRAAVGAITVTF
jgi:hypothetical protein